MQKNNLFIIIITIIISLAIILSLGGIDTSSMNYVPEMVLSSLCFIVSMYIIYKATECPGRLVMSPAISFVVLYIIFIYIGTIAHFLYSDEIITLIPYTFEDHNYPLLIVSNLSLICLALGVFVANKYSCFTPKDEITNYYDSEVVNDMPGMEINPVFIIALIICITCGLISMFAVPFGQLPIIYSFTHPGDVEGIMYLRNEFSSIRGIGGLQFFYIRILSLLSYIILGISMTSKSFLAKLMAIITIPTFLFFISMSAHRTYLLEYVFVFFIFLNYMGLKINVRNLLILGGLVLVLFSSFTISKMGIDFSGDDGLAYLARLTALRFFVDQMLPLAFVTENFPQQFNFLLGHTYFQDFTIFLPGVQETFSMWVSKELNPEIEDIGSAPTCLNGEFYANFSYPGVIIGMFLLGFIMQYAFIYFIRSRRNVSNVSLLTLINYSFCSLTIAGILFGFILRLVPVLIAFYVIKKTYLLVNPGAKDIS